MRQGCLAVCLGGTFLLAHTSPTVWADGPFARWRQRLAPAAAPVDPPIAPPPRGAIDELVNVSTVAPRNAPPVSTFAPLASTPPAVAAPALPGTVRITPPVVAAVPAGRMQVAASDPQPSVARIASPVVTRDLPTVEGLAANQPRPFPRVAPSNTSEIELTGLLTTPPTPTALFDPPPAPPAVEEPPTPPPALAGDAPEAPADNAANGSIAPQPLSGDGEAVDYSGLTLQQAEQMAVTNNPTFKQAAATTHKAMGTRRQIGKYPNPTIGYNADDIGEEGSAGTQGVFLQQTIMLGRKLELNQHVADWEVQALSWQTEAQRLRICNDVRSQFYATLGAQRIVDIAATWRNEAAENARLAAAYFEAAPNLQLEDLGTAKNEVLLAKVQAQRAELIYNNAQAELNGEWQRLACLLGEPRMACTRLSDTLDSTAGPRDMELAREQLLQLSPVLAQARAEVQRAAWRIQREQAQPIPNIQLQLIASHGSISGDQLTSVQAGLPIPLFNNNDGNVMRASADYRRSCWNVQRLELSLQSLLAEQFQQYQTAANTVYALEQRILPEFRTTRQEIEQNAGEFGVFFNVDKYLASQLEFESKRERIEALVSLRRAEVTLDGLLLTGAFDDLIDNEMDDTNRWNALSGQ